MLSAAPPKPVFFPELVPRKRLPSSVPFLAHGRPFAPAASAAPLLDPLSGENRTASGVPKSNLDPGGARLRGSDVLMAMQRAAAQKKRGGGCGRKGNRRRGSRSGEDEEQFLLAADDCGDVRPIEIRSDLGPRIDELERRIEELLFRYHS
ncbi:hypothetical protein AXF42_Ash014452 [Apostasia shenzhenica]|uniref:Uncharacterized protein n=1 Tax=Apostasia shenzhenica TaxID=1088818 RepID=A0A2H9ZWI6_9ASPA|nr:hypothetical protein AXF42_Ash014452 [Apostasia shenzhenica]